MVPYNASVHSGDIKAGRKKVPIKPAWFDTFFILRPTLFFPSWTFFLAGVSRGNRIDPFFYMIWIAAALGASFLLNQLTDRKEDTFNAKLLPQWQDLINEKSIYLELAVLFCFVLIGSIWVGLELTALLGLFFLIAGFLYNFPPFRLKGKPIWGIVSCSIGIWIGYLIGARAAGVPYSLAILFGLPYALAGAAVTLLTHVPDLKGDSISGIRTFPIVYGLSLTAAWATICVILAALISLLIEDYLLLLASIISLPFFILFFKHQTVNSAETAIKIAIFSLAFLISLTWLPFLFMIMIYFLFARWYHRNRLGIDYPSFKISINPR